MTFLEDLLEEGIVGQSAQSRETGVVRMMMRKRRVMRRRRRMMRIRG